MSAAPAAPRRPSVVDDVARPTWDEDSDWQKRAACRGADANLFFTPNHLEKKDEREAREKLAKAVCGGCAVRGECLAFALGTREPHGIWGGMNEIERRHLIQKQKRAG